jgi:hypothetical protein
MNGSPARLVVTLVHGTFAKGAAWTQEGSPIWRALKERFGDGAKIQRFDWSARNTHAARLTAGSELAQFLDASAAQDPGARNVVISHSHGGNVAIYALKDAAPGSLTDIVFLATPFIRCREAIRTPLFVYLGLFVLSLLLMIPPVVLLLPRDTLTSLQPYMPNNMPPVWAPLAVATVLCFGGLLLYLRRRAKKRISSLAWPAAQHARTLCVYYRTDEAKGYLSALNWGTTRLARLLWFLIGASIVAYFVYLGATLYVRAYHPSLYETLFFSTPRMWWGEGPGAQRGAWAELALYALAAWIPFAVLCAYALPFLRGHPLGYGWELPSSTMLVDLDVISEPVGFVAASNESFGIDIGEAKRQGLVHSFVYEDERILAKIVNWLSQRT